MRCTRCTTGLIVADDMFDPTDNLYVRTSRCINCGHVEFPKVLDLPPYTPMQTLRARHQSST